MLILTRRINETLINAPRDVPVHREEIYQRIKREERGDGESQSEKDDGYSSDHDYRGADYFSDEDSVGNK